MSKAKKKNRKKQIIIALIIIAIFVGVVILSSNRFRRSEEENKITTEKIEKRTIVSSISATGIVKSSDTKEFTTTLVGSEVKAVNVKVGDKVKMGQTIGDVGNSGASQGTHLHFEIWDGKPYGGGQSYNPLLFY